MSREFCRGPHRLNYKRVIDPLGGRKTVTTGAFTSGPVAQLAERLLQMRQVEGSSPFGSTIID